MKRSLKLAVFGLLFTGACTNHPITFSNQLNSFDPEKTILIGKPIERVIENVGVSFKQDLENGNRQHRWIGIQRGIGANETFEKLPTPNGSLYEELKLAENPKYAKCTMEIITDAQDKIRMISFRHTNFKDYLCGDYRSRLSWVESGFYVERPKINQK